ncbi:MAG: DUF3581 domain-containing protein [Candidatus Thiodiazotropha lotti]|uniref:DUF3581 family protein n=1 Tax=Candidatus Thiodiazotropha endoloripes TaxID=1818881 RepID=UPI00083D0625|nr:DUF3581 family protein [Candidatus Thiodiazotropha endoloripes]MCG7990003.1 DUF3581 domain-containing protein [Candidatus Thiodiazotropha lotti]MCW4181655.1 DUF3581 domain-containing protein [Candidatus Thiodiazotropha weberae]MCG8000666.1 DUF3581 domain-containing protein [Candidatus Thiodiazotropha lotti]MCW4192438.1 DUF3581 domain-containing protein [Candidatus Thiodiazotropha weberae]ODB86060.1 hypothetical protein A3195_10395 [Candidatus Thiodiazotropha endoloripes]
MILAEYFTTEGDKVAFSRQQASRFAKEIANDFNPLHNIDAKIFCVPGDLLFAVALDRFGLSQKMCFHFAGMVTDSQLIFSDSAGEKIDISDDEGKKYLSIQRQGPLSQDHQLISNLTQSYVSFSGRTFPHLLVPLMAEQNVMINPGRPLVMYESMEISLNTLHIQQPLLESTGSTLEVQGKKAMAELKFHIMENGREVGHGAKHMALRGLRAYQEEDMQKVVDQYNSYKQAYGS